ncbi:MAG: hypothetical protein ACFE0O_04330 [Opitutales bacterium]
MTVHIIANTNFGKATGPEDEFISHEDTIIHDWSRLVDEDDLVIHLGDVLANGFSSAERYLPLLPGRVLLTRSPKDNIALDPGNRLYGWICVDRFELRYQGRMLRFSHYPCSPATADLNIVARLPDKASSDASPSPAANILVFADQAGPLPLDTWLNNAPSASTD